MAIIEHAGSRSRVMCGLMLAVGLGLAGGIVAKPAHAQSTTARIFGQAPAGATVVAHSSSGLNRRVTVGDDGHYTLRNLPLSVYTVSLQKEGKTVDTRNRIPLSVGGGMEVNFACPQDHCAAVSGS